MGREFAIGVQIETLASEKQASSYDKAVELLIDLSDLAARTGSKDFSLQLDALKRRHSPKSSFIKRLQTLQVEI